MIEETTPAERDTMAREDADRKNRDALFALVAEHGLHISNRDLDRWRPTVPTQGLIDGFFDLGTLTCVATDGLQAWFTCIDRRPHLGHVQFFHWDNPVVSMVPYLKDGVVRYFKSVKDQGAPAALHKRERERTPRKESPKKRKKSKRMSILESI